MKTDNYGHGYTESGEYQEPETPYQELFNYMSDQHGVTLLEQDMNEIIHIVENMQVNRFTNIIKDVYEEFDLQDKKFGADRNAHPLEWLAVVTEEIGEVSREILEADFHSDNIKPNYRYEWIQVAAVALQAVLHHDNYLKPKP